MSQNWFCKVSGKEVGPLSSHQVKVLAAKGKLKPEDLIRQGEEGKWIPARRAKGLFPPNAAADTGAAKPVAAAHSQPEAAVVSEADRSRDAGETLDATGGLSTRDPGGNAGQASSDTRSTVESDPATTAAAVPPAPAEPPAPAAPAPLFSMMSGPLAEQPPAAPGPLFSLSTPAVEAKPAVAAPLFSMMNGPLAQPTVGEAAPAAPQAPATLFSMTAPLPEQPAAPQAPATLFSMTAPLPEQPAAPQAPATLFSMTAPLPEQPAAPASLFPQTPPPSVFAGAGGNAVPTPPPGLAASPQFPSPPSVFSGPAAASSAVIPLDRRSGSPNAVEAAKPFAPEETSAAASAALPRRRKKQSQLPAVLILVLFGIIAAMGWLAWKVYKSQTADLAQQQVAAAAKPKSAASSDQLSAEVERGGDKAVKKAAEPAAKPPAAANLKWYNAANADFTYGEKNVAVRVQSVLFGIPRFLIGSDVDRSKEQYMLIAIQVQNTSDKEPLKYESWAARGKPSCVRLTDNLGKTYAEKSFGTPLADGQYAGGEIPPGKTGDDLLFFEVPDRRQVSYLHLELPATNINGQGTVAFEIPRAMLGRIRQMMMADAAKHPSGAAPKKKIDLDDEINHPLGLNLDAAPGAPAAAVPGKPADAGKGGSAFEAEPAKEK
jgi:hypothetical protein